MVRSRKFEIYRKRLFGDSQISANINFFLLRFVNLFVHPGMFPFCISVIKTNWDFLNKLHCDQANGETIAIIVMMKY